MMMNPIYKKELKLGSRSIKLPLAIMFYNLLLSIIAVITIAICGTFSYYSGYDYQTMMSIFPIIAWTECGIMLIIIPVIAAGSISGERERQTLDIMLTTPVKPLAIVLGKVATAMTDVLMFVVSSVPIMAIAFILGGLNWWALLGYILIMIYIAFYVSSIGVLCSSFVKKTVLSIILTIVFEIVILVGTAAVFGLVVAIISAVTYAVSNSTGTVNYSITPFILMFNPISLFVDYTLRVMNTGSIKELLEETSGFSKLVTTISGLWIPISLFINVVIAFLFDLLAAKRINPLKKVS